MCIPENIEAVPKNVRQNQSTSTQYRSLELKISHTSIPEFSGKVLEYDALQCSICTRVEAA